MDDKDENMGRDPTSESDDKSGNQQSTPTQHVQPPNQERQMKQQTTELLKYGTKVDILWGGETEKFYERFMRFGDKTLILGFPDKVTPHVLTGIVYCLSIAHNRYLFFLLYRHLLYQQLDMISLVMSVIHS